MLKLQSVKRKFHWFELLSSSCASAQHPFHSPNKSVTKMLLAWTWLANWYLMCGPHGNSGSDDLDEHGSVFSLSLSTHVGLCRKRVHGEQCGVTPLTPFANYSLCDPQQREQGIHLPIRGHKHARPALKLYTCLCVSASHAPAIHWRLRKLSQLIFCPKC